ncbi:MAG: NAD(P)H-dependent oxidoreductase [Bacteroidetes bacterium]|nr:MAG: NAD(P)H-dependent oxidoreductase [Bacteroidota bacterium]
METEAHPVLEDMKWRYATKKYDPTRKISSEDLQILLDTIRLSPSSYGLQPYQFLVIENTEIRAQLKEKAFQQNQITDASHLILFCVKSDINDELIESYLGQVAKIREQSPQQLSGYGSFMKKKLSEQSPEERSVWASKQLYIVLGHLLHAAAQLKVDSTPIEGFEKEAFDEILGLHQKGLKSVVACALGYRSEDDYNQYQKKVRRTSQELITFIK